jgi:hypothetical protein
MVAGAAALMIERNPRLTNDQVKALLMQTLRSAARHRRLRAGRRNARHREGRRAIGRYESVRFYTGSPIVGAPRRATS